MITTMTNAIASLHGTRLRVEFVEPTPAVFTCAWKQRPGYRTDNSTGVSERGVSP